MDSRQINDKYAKIGQELIESEESLSDLRESEATIIYLSSEHEKTKQGKIILGECERIQEKYKWAVPCDFTITLFEPNIEDLTEEQLRIVILHELLHVGIRLDKEGNEEYYVVPHDVEDFRLLIDRYGIDWAKPGEDFEIIKGHEDGGMD